MKILIVEDDRNVALLLKNVVETVGYVPFVFNTAEGALEAYKQEFFPLIIIDIKLPGMDGMEFCRKIRQFPPGEYSFILVATGVVQPDRLADVLHAGADDYIIKPIDIQLMKIRLEIAKKQAGERLDRRKIKRRFQSLVQNSSDIITVLDEYGTILYRSPASTKRILGGDAQKFVGHFFFDFVHPEDMLEAAEIFSEIVEDKSADKILRFRVRHKHIDGTWRYLESSIMNHLSNPAISGIVMNSRDVTEYKKVEDGLLRLKMAVENMQLGVTVTDTDGEITYTNPAEAQMHGYQVSDLIGKKSSILAPPELRRSIDKHILRDFSRTVRESKNLTKDGRTFPVMLISSVVKDEYDDPVAMVTICEDISDKKQAQETIKKQQEKLELQYRRESVFAEIELSINQPHELQLVLDRIVRAITDLLPASGGAATVLWDEQSEEFYVSSTTIPGNPEEYIENRIRKKGGATHWIMEHQKSLIINDIRQAPFEVNPMLSNYNIKAFAGFPLIIDDCVVGVLYALDVRERYYSKEEQDFMLQLAIRAAAAIDKVRIYQRLITANDNLKREVYERKLAEEKSDALLMNILPDKVAAQLKDTGKTTPESFENVTVFLCDIVNFTSTVQDLEPELLISELNELFTAFDDIMIQSHCQRIETVGDAYLAVCGLPTPDDHHAENIAKAAIGIIRYLQNRKVEAERTGNIPWEVRIGIHTGKVVGGVVGIRKYSYGVFGDTINTAARMEENSQAMKINVSQATYQLIKDKFQLTPRPSIDVKGKGQMNMYFLNESSDFNNGASGDHE